jgi:hypothetical protein
VQEGRHGEEITSLRLSHPPDAGGWDAVVPLPTG